MNTARGACCSGSASWQGEISTSVSTFWKLRFSPGGSRSSTMPLARSTSAGSEARQLVKACGVDGKRQLDQVGGERVAVDIVLVAVVVVAVVVIVVGVPVGRGRRVPAQLRQDIGQAIGGGPPGRRGDGGGGGLHLGGAIGGHLIGAAEEQLGGGGQLLFLHLILPAAPAEALHVHHRQLQRRGQVAVTGAGQQRQQLARLGAAVGLEHHDVPGRDRHLAEGLQ